ncbi:hypothetical protein ZEAMMB73_Zm00001d019083 [Zea mays]|uniref:DUF4220 domain-containing protein n=3 Tax=Zea mays TaxID=4577 RepID=A0A1D6HUZ1_MAIZE|nr:hypothetical protein ZEAMMB73_Zm00001d019083 [Zea mays]
MAMDQPGSNQDGVVNMTRAMQALSPWLNHPRATITTVEVLVLAAAVLLLLQLFFGFYRRRWRSSFLGTGLRASSKLMDALVFYTLGTMQSSPIKNSLYPVWAAFLVMASTGTTVVQHYDFYDSFRNKYTEVVVDVFRYGFYGLMFSLLIDPNTLTLKTALDLNRHLKKSRASSRFVIALFYVALSTKLLESYGLAIGGYRHQKPSAFTFPNRIRRRRLQAADAETKEGSTTDDDPQSMKGYRAVVWFRDTLVLETPNPIIEVHVSRADYILTLLLLGIALAVELVQATLYLASDWAQVSLATMHVKKHWYETSASTFGAVIAFLRRATLSGRQQLMRRNRMEQYSVVLRQGKQGPVEVSDAVKRAVARSLISTYGGNLTTNVVEETSLQDMLIHHIATEYCDISGPAPSKRTTTRCRCSKHQGFFAANLSGYLFGNVLGSLLPNNRVDDGIALARRDNDRGVAVHLSRYCAYLIGSVPELLPYHEAEIAELAQTVMGERIELLGSSYMDSKIYAKMKDLEGTGEDDDPRKIFQKGIKFGKKLERKPDGDRWELLQEFWAKATIHAAKSHYTTEQHMQHLENGGEFLTHIWALLSHAGLLNSNTGNLGSAPSAAV